MSTPVSPGEVIGGYRIEGILGRGAMAEVYRARDAEGRLVALKLLEATLATDERFRARFFRESEIAATLDHPNIVRTLDSGADEGRLYLAMALVDGSDLRAILREEGRLDPERAVALVEQAAAALDAAHGEGLVHRDVKPGNILVDGRQAYVCDFGLARHVTSVSSLTGDRGFVGTIDYVPPEQIEGSTVDARADVYSLGCVLFECLTGVRPFDRDSELSVVFAHLNEPPPRVTDLRPELSAAFDDAIATALAKAPGERYSSCGELARAARAALVGRIVRRRRPRRRVLVGAALVVAAAVGATIAALVVPGSSHASRVTITPTSIRGAQLGDSNVLLQKLWGGGQKLTMDTPGNYAVLTDRNRSVSAYFEGTTDKAVEITTWNKNDRTADGIGPCSTLDDLKRVYGDRLKSSPHNRFDGKVFGWTVGKHMFFAMGPNEDPRTVTAVAIFDNELASAGFIALNEGPCGPAVVNTPVNRRTAVGSTPAVPKLAQRLTSHAFRPRVTLASPAGWSIATDTRSEFAAMGPREVVVRFSLDPRAVSTDGKVLPGVWTTAPSLARWLPKGRPDVVGTETQTFVGRSTYNAVAVDLRPRGRAPYLAFPSSSAAPLRPPRRGQQQRLYLIPIRIETTQHTLAILVDAPSASAFAAEENELDLMLRRFEVGAAPAGMLSALSSQCSQPWRGACVGELAPGTYRTQQFKPELTYTVPLGWTNTGDNVGFVGLIPPGGDFLGTDIGKSDRINLVYPVNNTREGCADGHGTAQTVDQMLRWLHHEPGFAPFTARAATIGGLSGSVVDLTMRPGWSLTCPWSHGLPIQGVITGPGDFNHGLDPPPMVMRLYLLRYKDGVLAIEVDDVTGDAAKLDSYDKVVRSFRFSH